MTGVDKQRPVFLIAVCFVCGLDLGSFKIEKQIDRALDLLSVLCAYTERGTEREGLH